VKRVTYRWQIPVAAEPRIITLKVEPDARLAAGAGGIARYLADSAGMASEASAELQAETVAACEQAFGRLPVARPVLQVRYALYSDRIEIELGLPDVQSTRPGQRLTRHFSQPIPSA